MFNSLKFMTHTRMRRKIASINKVEDKKKIHSWGPHGTPLGMLKVKIRRNKNTKIFDKSNCVNIAQPKMTLIQVNDGKAESCAKSRVLLY